MTNPDLQETIERLGILSRITNTEDIPARRIRELAFNSLTLLKAQQEQIAGLEAENRRLYVDNAGLLMVNISLQSEVLSET